MATGDAQIEFIIADLSQFAEREIVALALNADSNLRASPPIGTPIDTGWASANWVPSVGEPKILVSADKRDPTAADIAAARSAGAAGLNEVLAWKMEHGPIFVTNNVPYIQPLNAGHSTQSPAGFVQNALDLAVEETRNQAAQRGRSLDL